ncbi:adenylate/guanylate cyclase domain-containing protein [Chitinophaga sp. Ak27]|uniref:adenylate/guanylate cyclase domain-containing protein n=1 Tax=Chitinophaga sp. Ak27 TaxID=2726116 RepID=UPI00145FAC35|nr:adenylate/guanylate cyclase domain-containing protein [Chitinophaga sp. Ak27]NLU94882.1 adenylate/guanylate cyclase domain-containing protein [Chitinophaga sp. Ak27]
MANLDLIEYFNKKYSPPLFKDRNFSFNLNESFNPNDIQKGLDDSLSKLGTEYTMYFDLGMTADVALLFIDVCGFSTRFQHLDGDKIAKYFDNYYKIIIPLIYENGGVVEKVIGDGIIALFGPPFLSGSYREAIDKADTCAKWIISKTIGTDFSSKVAFHSGAINYFKNKSGYYKEFTMIGKPLTELFRLEGISENNCINYFCNTDVHKYYNNLITRSQRSNSTAPVWTRFDKGIQPPKGTRYDRLYFIQYKK